MPSRPCVASKGQEQEELGLHLSQGRVGQQKPQPEKCIRGSFPFFFYFICYFLSLLFPPIVFVSSFRNQPEFRQCLMLSVMGGLRRIRLFKIRASEFMS